MDSEPEFEMKVAAGPITSEFVDADGETHIQACLETNMSEEELREAVANSSGADPEEIDLRMVSKEEAADEIRGGRRVVSFRRWNSSWEPTGPKGDPALN